ncbi:MAG: SpoIID/LytB domain-containing protein [Bacteroidetes bacterium]|nr:SpoIID/LytB domain-containing protein [Bacteroidota bacterium]MBU1719948.1 SpoIID/LytB domain-containing protein [Bacteroidota bacterium]
MIRSLGFVIGWLFLSIGAFANGDIIKVRLLTALKVTSVDFVPQSYGYRVIGDDYQIVKLPQNNTLNISVQDSLIRLKLNGKDVGTYSRIKLSNPGFGNSFALNCISPKYKEMVYWDDLEVYVSDGELVLVNWMDIDFYVAGVVEAEGGFNANIEFYKAQAVICRTYAASQLWRHEGEGYNLCDQTHCQVYHGKCRNANILLAALSTSGITIIDDTEEYIAATFHSNCGGQTMNSEDVWLKEISYLRSVKDTFCLNQFRAKWDESYPLVKWQEYLRNNFKCEVNNESGDGYNFYQTNRKTDYTAGKCSIQLKQIRADWGLRSTFFTLVQKGDKVFLYGRGSGHGVGLCQAGAKRMAELGYSYRQIIHFYYKGVQFCNNGILEP